MTIQTDASELTSAHLVVDVQNPHAMITKITEGDLLGRSAQTIFLSHYDGAYADINIGRLSREMPGVSGNGTLASLELVLPAGETPMLRVRYELRDSENNLVGFGQTNEMNSAVVPNDFGLKPAYPNPFNPSTHLTFTLPEAANITLRAFNVMGQEVNTILEGRYEAGEHTITWNAENSKSALPTGVYFVRLDALGRTSLQKVVLIK